MLIDYLNESKDMLDISIMSADKFLTSASKIEKFLSSNVSIEAKTDGVKLTVLKVADNGNLDDYIFAYKGNILYYNEFNYQSLNKIKSESIGASQFKLVFDHFEKLEPNTIPVGTELQIEYLMSKPTLSSNYKYKHRMVLIGYSKSNYKISFGKIRTQNTGLKTQFRDKYAKDLKINIPLKLFDGILGSPTTFERGILNDSLRDLYNKNKNILTWDNLETLYTGLKTMFLEVPSKFGGKEEGVVIKYDNVLLKWQQSYQLDQNARAAIKQKYREDVIEDENQYWENVKGKAYNIVQGVKKSTNINKMLGDLSDVIKRLDINFKHSKKTIAQIKDDIQLNAKTLLLKSITGNNGALIIGKFRVLTNGHHKLIQSAIKEYSRVAICLVSSKELQSTKDFRRKMIEAVYGNKIEIVEHNNGNIIRILDKIPFNVNVVFAGSDRVVDYQKQVRNTLGLTVREMYRTGNDISATKVIENINNYEFFKENTPRQIHQFYDEIKKVWEN